VDVLAGGIICKGFSGAGYRSPVDERNYLYLEQLRLVDLIRPKNSLIENVPLFKTSKIVDKTKCPDELIIELNDLYTEQKRIGSFRMAKRGDDTELKLQWGTNLERIKIAKRKSPNIVILCLMTFFKDMTHLDTQSFTRFLIVLIMVITRAEKGYSLLLPEVTYMKTLGILNFQFHQLNHIYIALWKSALTSLTTMTRLINSIAAALTIVIGYGIANVMMEMGLSVLSDFYQLPELPFPPVVVRISVRA
jgi:hypothetical protein